MPDANYATDRPPHGYTAAACRDGPYAPFSRIAWIGSLGPVSPSTGYDFVNTPYRTTGSLMITSRERLPPGAVVSPPSAGGRTVVVVIPVVVPDVVVVVAIVVIAPVPACSLLGRVGHSLPRSTSMHFHINQLVTAHKDHAT